jgi:steroid 5-alpha reductase family enzyme
LLTSGADDVSDFLSVYRVLGLVMISFFTLLWLVSLLMKNASIVDIFWGTGFVVTAWVSFALTPDGFMGRKLLLVCLVDKKPAYRGYNENQRICALVPQKEKG